MGPAVQEASRNLGGDFHQRDPRRPDRRRGASDRRLRTCVIQAFAIGKKWPPHLFYLPVVLPFRASGRDLPRLRRGWCPGAVFHWPTLSESVQWIKKRMPNPSHIMIRKDSVQASRKVIDIEDFNHEWMDEISLITGITGGQVHKSIIRPVLLKNWITGFSARSEERRVG